MATAEDLTVPTPEQLDELATARVPVARVDETAGEVRATHAGSRLDSVAPVAVLDGRPARRPGDARGAARGRAKNSRRRDHGREPPVLTPGADQERAAWAMVAAGESALAVEDVQGRFAGMVPPTACSRCCSTSAAPISPGSAAISPARSRQEAATEPVVRRLWHRLPWLLLGLFGAMTATVLVGAFEAQLEAKVLLAFFVPASSTWRAPWEPRRTCC